MRLIALGVPGLEKIDVLRRYERDAL